MPHRAPQDRPFRARTAALLVGVLAVSLAARSQTGGTTAAPQPPATPAAMDTTKPVEPAGPDSAAMTDSIAPTSMAMDSTHMQMTMAAEPAAAAAPTEWPVDPATGQTLINGIPVVGKVFIMQKTDGTRKIETVAQALAGEAYAALPPVVGASAAPAAGQTRRMRGVMIQATLWMNDNKAKAVHNRYYPSTTSGESLGQQY